MEFFRLIPDAQGYSWKPSAAVANRIEVEGGFDVRRTEFIGMTNIYNLTFTVGPADYEYIADFVDAYFKKPTWFHMLLLSFPLHAKFPLERHAVQIMPGSYQLAKVDGFRYTVNMIVEGYADPADIPTSRLYPWYLVEEITTKPEFPDGRMYFSIFKEGVVIGGPEIEDGILKNTLVKHDPPQIGSVTITEPVVEDGTLRLILQVYNHPEIEQVRITEPVVEDGTLIRILVRYNEMVPDAVAILPPAIENGTLS